MFRSYFLNEFYEDFDIIGLIVRSPTSLYVANVQHGILTVNK